MCNFGSISIHSRYSIFVYLVIFRFYLSSIYLFSYLYIRVSTTLSSSLSLFFYFFFRIIRLLEKDVMLLCQQCVYTSTSVCNSLQMCDVVLDGFLFRYLSSSSSFCHCCLSLMYILHFCSPFSVPGSVSLFSQKIFSEPPPYNDYHSHKIR